MLCDMHAQAAAAPCSDDRPLPTFQVLQARLALLGGAACVVQRRLQRVGMLLGGRARGLRLRLRLCRKLHLGAAAWSKGTFLLEACARQAQQHAALHISTQ